MKYCLLFLLSFSFFAASAQINYPRQNIELISHITPNFGVGGVDGRLYSGCWGWYQADKNKEYAISGASNGTYFIDVTNPATPTVCAYVGGKLGCTWREIKTYKNWCYIISDDPKPNKFQIVDMQYLPDSVHIVHNDTTLFSRGHTLWVDNDKLYVATVTYTTGFSTMNVYSLATPSVPVLLRELQQDIPPPLISDVHDLYSRNDTIYASCGWQGLYVLKYNSVSNTFSQIGSYSGYASGSAYNHSSWLTQNGKYMMFCDEVPGGLPIKWIDVQNLANIQPLQTFSSFSTTTPHNPYLLGNDFAVVACYQDGLQIYDISQPNNVAGSGYFDTHPQGGGNVGDYFGNDYRGNWGAYPYLPSGIIIAQDMQNGVFILDATAAFNNRVGITENSAAARELSAWPNPASEAITLQASVPGPVTISLSNLLGQVVYEKEATGPFREQLNVRELPQGAYLISIKGDKHKHFKKIIIQH